MHGTMEKKRRKRKKEKKRKGIEEVISTL